MCGAHVSRVCTQVPAQTLQPFAPQPGLHLLVGQDGQGARLHTRRDRRQVLLEGKLRRSRVLASQGRLSRERKTQGEGSRWGAREAPEVQPVIGGRVKAGSGWLALPPPPPSTPGPRGCTSAAGKPTGSAGTARGSVAPPGQGRPSWVSAGRGSAHPADGRSSVGVRWGALPAQVVALRPTNARGRQHSPAAPQPHPDLAAGRGAPRPSWSPKRAVSLRAGRCPGPGPPSSSRGDSSVRGPEPPAERG